MAQIKLRIELNRGRVGAPLEKLGDVARQLEKFLRAISADLKLEVRKGEWLAVNFKNGSVSYDAALQADVSDGAFREFNRAVEFVADFDPDTEGTNGIVSDATLMEYGRIGQYIDPDEWIGIGIYPLRAKTPKRWRRVTYHRTSKIKQMIEAPLASYGSVQGIVHALAKEAPRPFFQLREFATDNLVRCFYSEEQYGEIISALKERRTVVHASGRLSLDRAKRTVEEVSVERIDKTELLSSDEFERLFGSAPHLTGDLSTNQFIDQVRSDGD